MMSVPFEIRARDIVFQARSRLLPISKLILISVSGAVITLGLLPGHGTSLKSPELESQKNEPAKG